MTKPFHSSKEFLNLPGCNSDASIFTQVSFYSEESSSCDCTLKIRDCGNIVHLSVGLNDEGDRAYENTLFKLDVLINELTKFKAALVEAKVIHTEREKLEELERQKREKDYEMDSRDHVIAPKRGISNPTPSPTDGLEDLQGAIFTPPNV